MKDESSVTMVILIATNVPLLVNTASKLYTHTHTITHTPSHTHHHTHTFAICTEKLSMVCALRESLYFLRKEMREPRGTNWETNINS